MPDLIEMQKERSELACRIQNLLNEFMEKYRVDINSIELTDASSVGKHRCIVEIKVEL